MVNRKKLLMFLVIATAIFTVSPVQAVLIVDTGPGPAQGSGWSLDSAQSLAAEFTITEAYTVNEILGWIGLTSGNVTATIALYSDGGEIPGTELFSTQFSVPFTSLYPNWYGASGLTVPLLAGTYWVAFEVRTGDTLQGAMVDPASNPLANEAYTWLGTWNPADYLGLGIRIDATLAPVPEPATMLLLASGLVGLVGFRRKFRK